MYFSRVFLECLCHVYLCISQVYFSCVISSAFLKCISQAYFSSVFLKYISHVYFSSVFLKGISQVYFSSVFLKGISQGYFSSLFLNYILSKVFFSQEHSQQYFSIFQQMLRAVREKEGLVPNLQMRDNCIFQVTVFYKCIYYIY